MCFSMGEVTMLINKYIKDVLIEHNISAEFVADGTGFSVGRIMEILNDNAMVSPEEANRILDVVDVSLWDVLCNY